MKNIKILTIRLIFYHRFIFVLLYIPKKFQIVNILGTMFTVTLIQHINNIIHTIPVEETSWLGMF